MTYDKIGVIDVWQENLHLNKKLCKQKHHIQRKRLEIAINIILIKCKQRKVNVLQKNVLFNFANKRLSCHKLTTNVIAGQYIG